MNIQYNIFSPRSTKLKRLKEHLRDYESRDVPCVRSEKCVIEKGQPHQLKPVLAETVYLINNTTQDSEHNFAYI